MMKKFLLFLLLFVNLQIVMHEDEVVLNAGMEAAAQVMATEQYTCWDDIGKSWYTSSMSCDFDGGINIHECSYCKKTHESDEARKAHEKVCSKRPKRGGGGSTGPGNTGGGFSGYDLGGGGSDGGTSTYTGQETGRLEYIDTDMPKMEIPVKIIEEFRVEPIKIPPMPQVPEYVPVHHVAAVIAALAYHDKDFYKYVKFLEEKGWLIADDEAKKMGLVLHDDLTGLDCTLLKSADGQSYVLSFAGTELKKSFPEVFWQADGLADIGQALGACPPQYLQALAISIKLNEVLDGKNLSFVGHSLGGGLAAFCSILTGRYAMTFNPAGLSWFNINSLDTLGLNHGMDNIYRYVMQGDPVDWVNSITPVTSAGHLIEVQNYTNGKNTHSITNMVNSLNPNNWILIRL